ncbi:MAG: PH domain-containing protein [Actinobacteria bacterium]|nr:PH domain-containing protein [Actinomycetota bacterium]MCA1721618.1 PH domain-containing protein [Actinomycetota bacterium]
MTVYRPRKLRLVAHVATAALVLVFGVLAYLLPARQGEGAATFSLGDQIAFFVIGLLLAYAAHGLTRARVEADERGIRVRNYIGEKHLPWQVVAGVRMAEGASWATLDLHDDDTVALLAIQSNDGAYAVEAVVELRRLLAMSRNPGNPRV